MSASPIPVNAKRIFVALIGATLDRHAQRATYGAVAALVGMPNQAVMQGQPKCARNSWIVSADTGQPSGYRPEDVSPRLGDSADVIRSAEALAAWLEIHVVRDTACVN